MEITRRPFQGLLNIIRFNWHFYVFAFALAIAACIAAGYLENPMRLILYLICVLISVCTLSSLLVSFYVYDLSGLYKLSWIDNNHTEIIVVNINAGFDETSVLLKEKFKTAELLAFDFYDPLKHTEISIRRARKAYPPFPATIQVQTTDLPSEDNSADKIFVLFSAHEIRDEVERLAFFKELKRIIRPNGQIYITEHLRDIPNFLAYNIGFLHFYARGSWLKLFKDAGLTKSGAIKLNPFISTFILSKNGNTH